MLLVAFHGLKDEIGEADLSAEAVRPSDAHVALAEQGIADSGSRRVLLGEDRSPRG